MLLELLFFLGKKKRILPIQRTFKIRNTTSNMNFSDELILLRSEVYELQYYTGNNYSFFKKIKDVS